MSSSPTACGGASATGGKPAMLIVDAGPLYAAAARRDKHHRAPRAPPLIGARNVEYRTRQHGSHEFTQQSGIWAGRWRSPR
jgi:hypothetical protein